MLATENEGSSGLNTTVAVLGIGAMGGAMAGNLLAADFDVRVWNRSAAKARALAAQGATACATPAEAVTGADVVLTSLYDAAAVGEVLERAAEALRPGSVWAELSTLGINDVAGLARFAEDRGVTFVDAPVQGARPLAEQGQLLIYAAGPSSAQAALEPIFSVLGRRTDWLSTEWVSTAATAVKLVVNGWVFALTTAAAEAVALARALGADPEAYRAAIAGGPLDNAWAQMRSAAMIEEDFAPLFPVHAAGKDAALIGEAAAEAGVTLDVANAVQFGHRTSRGVPVAGAERALPSADPLNLIWLTPAEGGSRCGSAARSRLTATVGPRWRSLATAPSRRRCGGSLSAKSYRRRWSVTKWPAAA